jgi:hypothetical protein
MGPETRCRVSIDATAFAEASQGEALWKQASWALFFPHAHNALRLESLAPIEHLNVGPYCYFTRPVVQDVAREEILGR